jgi:hypothetical protein
VRSHVGPVHSVEKLVKKLKTEIRSLATEIAEVRKGKLEFPFDEMWEHHLSLAAFQLRA